MLRLPIRPSGLKLPTAAASVIYSLGMKTPAESFERLYEIMKRLRAPDGCPWDREQTPKSIRGNLVEETYECVEAVNSGDVPHIREEIGDVFLVLTFMTYMFEQEGSFSVADALEEVSDKLVRRHPHVFGDASADTPDKVVAQWKDIKVTQEGKKPKDSLLDEVSHALPPLDRAYKIQKKAAKAGFDWKEPGDVWAKVKEEADEAAAACKTQNQDELEDELGDLLFSVVNVARFLKVDPSVALSRTIVKFTRRFKDVERLMKDRGLEPAAEHFVLMDELWNRVKQEEKAKPRSRESRGI